MKARSLVCIVVPVVAAFAFAAGPAYASTPVFQASVKSISPKGNPVPCAHTICGTANVAGYGSGAWVFDVTSFGPPNSPTPCAPYTAFSTFDLASGTLVLDETGEVCAPGNSGSAPRTGIFGAPWTDITGCWTVDSARSTGAFARLSGAGSDSGKITGPVASGTYTETLCSSS